MCLHACMYFDDNVNNYHSHQSQFVLWNVFKHISQTKHWKSSEQNTNWVKGVCFFGILGLKKMYKNNTNYVEQDDNDTQKIGHKNFTMSNYLIVS